jgi:hypothetical protein
MAFRALTQGMKLKIKQDAHGSKKKSKTKEELKSDLVKLLQHFNHASRFTENIFGRNFIV